MAPVDGALIGHGEGLSRKRTLSSSRDTRSSTLLSPASNCCFLLAGGHRSSTAFGCSLLRLTPSMTCRRSVYSVHCFSKAWISTGASCLPMRSVCIWFSDPPGQAQQRRRTNYRCGPGASGRNRARCLASKRTACLIRAKGNLNINQVDAIYGSTLHGIIHHHTWQRKSLLVATRFGESGVNRANSSRLIRIIPYSIGGPRGLEPKESRWPAFICTLSHVHWGP